MPPDARPQAANADGTAAMPGWAGGARQRARLGRRSYHAGLAAEEIVARDYAGRGAEILARRHRTPHGEIDLIVRDGGHLVFVEVKRRKQLHAFDSPISESQWNRLGCAALHYVVQNHDVTCTQPVCRFDAALVGPDGGLRIIQNARTFD